MKRAATFIVAVWVMAACSATGAGIVPDAQMSIGIANGTSIAVELVVNGSHIRTIPATTDLVVQAADLPTLPWQAVLTTTTGRTLVSLAVHSGDVHRSAGNLGGVAQRVDLSCGRLDVYSGPPMLGPMPGPGVPGDCN